MHNNRTKKALSQHLDKQTQLAVLPEGATAPGRTVTTQQVYNAAWAMAKRDWELNRLFNAWYYEI